MLYSEDGYVYLDVRPEIEVQEVGRVKNSVNIPIQNATRKYDPEQKKKVVQRTPNDGFVAAVKKRFPDTGAKLLVACSDGRKYSMDALMALDEAGYTNLTGLKARAAPVHPNADCALFQSARDVRGPCPDVTASGLLPPCTARHPRD